MPTTLGGCCGPFNQTCSLPPVTLAAADPADIAGLVPALFTEAHAPGGNEIQGVEIVPVLGGGKPGYETGTQNVRVGIEQHLYRLRRPASRIIKFLPGSLLQAGTLPGLLQPIEACAQRVGNRLLCVVEDGVAA